MWKKFLLSLLIAFIPIQSWAVISMGLQHKQNALVIAQPNEATANHACHQNNNSSSVDAQISHQQSDNSGCGSCTLCMAIGFLQAPNSIDLTNIFSQAFHSNSLFLIGIDVSNLTKPPIH